MNFNNYYKNKVVLVTGGAGAIGRNLSEKLAQLGAEKVIILDNLSSSYKWNIPDLPNISFVQGDIRNQDDLMRVFRQKPQVIFHLAAFFANQNSVDYPLINEEVNIVGLLKLLELSTISKSVEKFVFANSEGGAYGDTSSLPYTEDDISIDLGSPYYISKLSGESYCRYYHKQFGLPVSIARLFNSYGPGEVPGQYRNVIPNFIYWSMLGKTLPLTGDVRIARDFVYVDDTANGLLSIGFHEKAIGESFNISSGKSIRIYDLADMINSKTGNNGGVRIIGQRKWDNRPEILGDPSKTKVLLGFIPETNFEDGLDKTINWFQENWDAINSSAEFPPGLHSALETE